MVCGSSRVAALGIVASALCGCDLLLGLDSYGSAEPTATASGGSGGSGAGAGGAPATGGSPDYTVTAAISWPAQDAWIGALATNVVNDVFVAGGFRSSLDAGPLTLDGHASVDNIFVAALEPSLTEHRWSPRAFVGQSGRDGARAQAVAANTTDLYLVGSHGERIDLDGSWSLSDPGTAEAGFVTRQQVSDGIVSYAAMIGGSLDVSATAIAQTVSHILVGGTFISSVTFGGITENAPGQNRDVFVVRRSSNGQEEIAWVAGGPGDEILTDMAVAPDGSWAVATGFFEQSVWFNGRTATATGQNDVFVAGLSGDGQIAWLTTFGGALADIPFAVAVGPNGTTAVAGSFDGMVTIGRTTLTAVSAEWDAFVALLDSGGVPIWAISFNGQGKDLPDGIAIDADGNIYVVGHGTAPIDCGGGELPFDAGEDAFVASLDPQGAHRWSFSTPGPGLQQATEVIARPDGRIVVGGRFETSLSYPGGTLRSAQPFGLFLLAIDQPLR